MPFELAVPQQSATVDAVEWPVSPHVASRGSVSVEAEETTTHGATVAAEWVAFELPRSAAPMEPTLEDRTPLSRAQQTGKAKVTAMGIPELEWPTRADSALTVSVRRLLRTLWAIVVSRAMQVSFPLRRTVVSVFEDPTEQERKAVLRLGCNATVAQALAFWDSLEPDLQDWLKTLSKNDRTTFITNVSLRVHWQ